MTNVTILYTCYTYNINIERKKPLTKRINKMNNNNNNNTMLFAASEKGMGLLEFIIFLGIIAIGVKLLLPLLHFVDTNNGTKGVFDQ